MSNKKKRKNTKRKVQQTRKGMHYSMSVVILAFCAVLSALFVYIKADAILSDIIRSLLLNLFSVSAYILPFVLGGLAIYVSRVKRTDKLTFKLTLSMVSCIIVSALYQLFTQGFMDYSALAVYATELVGGGIIGGCLANILHSLLGTAISSIILIFALLCTVSIIIKISVFSLAATFISGLFKMRDEIEEVNYYDSYEQGKKVGKKISTASNTRKDKKKNFDFSVGEGENDKKKEKETEAVATVKELETRIDEIVFNPDIPVDDEDVSLGVSLDEVEKTPDEEQEEPSKPAGEKKPQKVEAVSEEEKTQIKEEIDDSIETKVIEYVFPPISLLNKPVATSADKRREMQETANKLMEILRNFGVEAKLLQVTQGPSVTRYEIQPNTGIKLAKITGLAEDIALNLAVPTVLVAAVPGKAAVGIEVPNTSVNMVSVRELLESTKFRDASSKLTVAFGKDIGGNVVVGDIAKMPHVLIAGSTGSGKSVCINTIITSILYKAKPEEVKLIMVDPKVVELGVYNGIPHLLIPVVTDPKRAAGALNWAVGEMMRRYALFAETGSRNLTGYNELMVKTGEEKLPQIVIIIDELADLMMVAAKEVEDYICRLAQLARAAGIHLIIATQRPSVDVITGLIKANVPSRIAFAVSSQVDSRTILDKGGAEKLLGKGDMLYHPTGLSNALRVQGAFVSDAEIENVISFIKENSEVTHYSDDLAEHLDKLASGDVAAEESQDEDDADDLLPEAINLAVELGQISTAMIQRRLKVGYARAGRIIDQMEMRGIISGANGSKPREVYMNRIDMNDFN
ncbi:MAG: DNA translocase FtsK [Clostridia bacterium]|nr:DNA translocase FtsK [Clostridia bacterium]